MAEAESVTFDGTNHGEVWAVLGAVRGGIKFADYDEPGSPPNITAELPDGRIVDINVGDIVIRSSELADAQAEPPTQEEI